jgi:probable HAF family extracellular repeat protein
VAGDSTGADINDGGEVAGTSETNQIDSHAFLYTQGAMMDLGTGIGEGINNAGQVVGQGLFSGSRHAFVYGAGAMKDLGTLPGGTFSEASGINLAGKIVGFSDTSNGAFHAAVFGGSTVIDIGTLPGFDDSLATKVNAAGQIIGISWPGALNTDTDLGLTGVPANITVNATHPSGAVLTYSAPTAIDEAGDIPAPTVSCIPSSGSTFVVGTTTVTCTASSADDTPSTVSGTFTVTVTFKPTPASIKADVNQFLASGMIKNAGVANSLLAKLDAASAAQASGDCAGAAAIYQALINELQAQSGKGVAAVAASPLILEVQFLIANCP